MMTESQYGENNMSKNVFVIWKNENNSITYQRDHKIDGGGGHIGHIGSIQNGIGFLWDIGLSQFYCGQF